MALAGGQKNKMKLALAKIKNGEKNKISMKNIQGYIFRMENQLNDNGTNQSIKLKIVGTSSRRNPK